MRIKLIAAILLIVSLSGCMTRIYVPMEYPLRPGLIPALATNGTVNVNNAQDSTSDEIVYSYVGTKLASNYRTITQLMVDQTKAEIKKNTQRTSSGKPKTLDMKVTYLKSRYITFFWKSELKYTVVLGGSVTIEKTVNHASGILIQDLNGCIAESVINLLNDPQIIAYLAE